MAAVADVAGGVSAADVAARRVCFGGGEVWLGDNLPLLRGMASASVRLIYIDPPFNTGKTQTRKSIRVRRADVGENGGGDLGNDANRAAGNLPAGDDNANRGGDSLSGGITDNDNLRGDGFGRRVGFGGRLYYADIVGETGYDDSFADYEGFLRPRLQEAHRLLCDNGSLFFHIDWREAAKCRILLEEVFGGEAHCINELIWAYDFGGRGKNKWPAKHDNIYWFAKNPREYVFNYQDIDRIPYMAPGLAGETKAARGKTPTDVWWQTIVPTNGKEKTGYATQKPLKIIDRIVRVHSKPGDMVLDFFAGSGTTAVAAANNGRRFIMIDKNPQAFEIMQKRLTAVSPVDKKTTTPKKTQEKK